MPGKYGQGRALRPARRASPGGTSLAAHAAVTTCPSPSPGNGDVPALLQELPGGRARACPPRLRRPRPADGRPALAERMETPRRLSRLHEDLPALHLRPL